MIFLLSFLEIYTAEERMYLIPEDGISTTYVGYYLPKAISGGKIIYRRKPLYLSFSSLISHRYKGGEFEFSLGIEGIEPTIIIFFEDTDSLRYYLNAGFYFTRKHIRFYLRDILLPPVIIGFDKTYKSVSFSLRYREGWGIEGGISYILKIEKFLTGIGVSFHPLKESLYFSFPTGNFHLSFSLSNHHSLGKITTITTLWRIR